MHTVSYVSLSTWKRFTWAQRIIGSHSAPELPTASVRPSDVSFHPSVCVLPCPTASYIKSTQFETYRRCLPLCVFVDSSRVKPVFIAIRAPRNPLPRDTRYGRERERRSRDEKSSWVWLSQSQERRNPAAPGFHNGTIHLLARPDVRHDLYRAPISRATLCCWKRICQI